MAIAVAIVAALLYAVGSVAQQKAASAVPTEEATGARLLTRLVANPVWLLGVAGDALGFAGQAVALALGSLALVQPLLVTSLLFALPLSAAWAGRRLKPADGLWALLLTAGLAVFVVAGDPTAGVDRTATRHWLVTGAVLLPVIAGCLLGARASRSNRALLLGVVTGILFGLTAALVKSVMSLFGAGLVDAVLLHWEVHALIVIGATSFIAQANAFQAGELQLSMPVMTVLDPVVSTLIGVTILRERIQAHGAEWLLIGAAVVAMAVGTAALARSAAALEPTPTG
ncbi:MAG: DMT family transporter [Actinomycetota bacterium]|nr:DMT family transporter [Actinomycetota bacterium]